MPTVAPDEPAPEQESTQWTSEEERIRQHYGLTNLVDALGLAMLGRSMFSSILPGQCNARWFSYHLTCDKASLASVLEFAKSVTTAIVQPLAYGTKVCAFSSEI